MQACRTEQNRPFGHWPRGRVIALLLLAAMLVNPVLAIAQERVALVIGVGAYQNVGQLANPPNDARLIAEALKKLSFDTQVVVDPTYEDMKHALRDFGLRLAPAKVALFFYAGHGVQVAGRNYLLPVNAALTREQDLRYEAFDVQAVLEEMDGPGRVNLIFLDACRNDPQLARSLAMHMGSRGGLVGRGLAGIDTNRASTLIAFATAPGEVAADGSGVDSPFTTALAQHIGTAGLDVRQMLTRVRADVKAATGNVQVPWVNESLDADFYFVPATAPAVAPPAVPAVAPPPAAAAPPPAASSGVTAEMMFWQSIETNGGGPEFQAYLQQFPNGTFAPLARARLAAVASARPVERPVEKLAVAPPQDCDRLAQPSYNALGRGQTFVSGVEFDKLDTNAVLNACDRAIGDFPDEVRFQLWRGRALVKLGRDADAVTLFRRYSDQGNAIAQATLGVMYNLGRGVPNDPGEAVRLFRLAADRGLPLAQANLAEMYQMGRGVKQDSYEAARLLRLASDQGFALAQTNLGWMSQYGKGIPTNAVEAVRFYRLAADQGFSRGQASLATMYYLGNGVSQNYNEATRLFRIAAAQGDAQAQNGLGFMNRYGNGMPQNYYEAVRLFRLAADQGLPEGQLNLGIMYYGGLGVASNRAEGIRLLRLAARQGNELAQKNLRDIHQNW
jgi:TPR repeat protein